MMLYELLNEGKRRLSKAHVPDPGTDSILLMEHALKKDRAFIYSNMDMIPDKAFETDYMELIGRREKREPLQYIIGHVDFMGYTINVDRRVLIPRFDTEWVVNGALDLIKDGYSVLDMCTGSGCIIIAIFGSRRLKRAVGSDISKDALDVAKDNASANGINDIEWIESDLFSHITGKFDLIISNPPYITRKEMGNLQKEVEEEPYGALFGGTDGLDYYRRIIKDAGGHLKKSGYLALETGSSQREDVSCMLRENGFEIVSYINDLAGLDRGIIGRLSEE